MNYVIIGGSAAGVTAAEILRKYDKKSEITLVSDETFPLYSRCLLTYLMAGSIDESKLYFKDKNFYKDNNVKTYLGKKAVSIDKRKKIVSLEDKTKISYDKLLLATGASAKLVDITGVDKKGIFTVRKIDDARLIMGMLDYIKEVAVLGGGLIGLRDAYALRLRQKGVAVVVKSHQVLSQMVDMGAARIIASTFEKNGINIMTGLSAKEIIGRESVEGILLDNGERLNCQVIIIGKGVNPNTELALSCGLKVEEGIVVDEFLRTCDDNIFAAGDVAETYDIARESRRVNALWPCAVEQGEIAALNMLGKEMAYDGSLSMNSVDFFGLSCISMGITKSKKEEGYEEDIREDKVNNVYKKIVVKDNRLVGMILIGKTDNAGVIGTLIRKKIDISSIKHLILDDNFGYGKILPLVKKEINKFGQEEFQDTILTYYK